MEEQIRLAAFDWLKTQCEIHGEVQPRQILTDGFVFQGERITLVGASGIWKPKQFQIKPLSITSIINGPYADKMTDDGFLTYKYRGDNPNHRDNIGLRLAMETKTLLIYFASLSPGKYMASFPAFIIQDNPAGLEFTVALDEQNYVAKPENRVDDIVDQSEYYRRKYITSTVQIRLHQQSFRERVIAAYNTKCCLCKINHYELLDAAHIVPDNEEYGHPIIPNGLTLCKIHHAAFDSNIIGITPDYDIKVRTDILEEIDGPMLKHGIQEMNNHQIILPSRRKDYPDKERLEWRYERFRRAG
jgi:putative restriction endonuclease